MGGLWRTEELSLGLLMNNSDEWESLRSEEWFLLSSKPSASCSSEGRLSPQLALTHTNSLFFLSQGPPCASRPSSLILSALQLALTLWLCLFLTFPTRLSYSPSQSPSEGGQHAWLRNSSNHIQTQPFSKIIKEDFVPVLVRSAVRSASQMWSTNVPS